MSAGCRRAIRPAPPLSDELESKRLSKLSDDYWQFLMRENPVWATFLGDRRYDTELEDLSEQGFDRRHDELKRMLEEADGLDPNKLAEADRITREALLSLLSGSVARESCKNELWNVNALDGVQAQLDELPSLHSVAEPEQGKALEVRYLKSGVLLDQHMDNLRRGLSKGYSAPRLSVERVIGQLERMLRLRPEESLFLSRVQLPEHWRDATRQGLKKELSDAVRSAVYPALSRYLSFLRNEYLPAARDEVGLAANKGGKACYEANIRASTGSELSAEDIHKLGLAELEKNEAEMRRIAVELTGRDDLVGLKKLLSERADQHVKTSAELLAYNRAIVERAQSAMAKAFGRVPTQKVVVKEIDPVHAKSAPSGYYYQGSRAERRPGYYFLNTDDAPSRLLFQMEPLAFHETVPGHHLQIGLAQELHGLPRFRQEVGEVAFKEGWAHYAELLADELKLYSSPESRYGMLSDQALRAVRLVVDTGIHALGWSREQALAFMLAHTAEPMDSAVREIDRYIAWPGQALGYKLGQLEILALRQEAQERLGPRFNLRAFHDRLLANGAIPLPVLRRVMSGWVEEVARAGSNAPQVRSAAHR